MNEEMKQKAHTKANIAHRQSIHMVCRQINQFADACDCYIYSIDLDLKKKKIVEKRSWCDRVEWIRLWVFKSATKRDQIIPFESMNLIERIPTAQY